MNRKFIVIGGALSVALHVAFLNAPVLWHKEKAKVEPVKCPVVARVPEVVEEEKVAAPEPVKAEPVPEENVMEELFKPDSVETEEAAAENGNIKIAEADDEYMPALRVDISDYRAVIGAVRYFKMRILLVNGMGNFVDEISLGFIPEVVPIKNGLSEYSNRIRVLPAKYFGKRIANIMRIRGLKACILVPAAVDREFAMLQKDAVALKGYELESVTATAGRFVGSGRAYRLVIDELHLKDGEEVLL